ncbi:MAG TPA: protein kinase [Gemmatimonadales bacterium]|jgi:serine/threonine-protein kinase|nr:protein kinase [Gemmatimonadales bacterium]
MTQPPSRLADAVADLYRLERELGAGGMATVYLAEDLKHHRHVAIKVLKPELAAVIGAERFLREINTIATLQHPHILGLIDSGEVNGTAYYVMPFVEGESLRDRLNREKQLPINDAVRLATEVASALDYAHRHGVIHRDIKPENILLHDGSALVADFGIALAASKAGGTRMTETGMSLGTPHYMSPEQAMGEREITARSDVYALGCVTYEMLVGEPPFTGPTAQAIVAKMMTEEPRSLTMQRRTIPPYVDAAVGVALSKLPADRFASAAEFAGALRDETMVRRSGGTERTISRASSRFPVSPVPSFRRSVIGLSVALVITGALALWGWLGRAPRGSVSRQRVALWNHSFGQFLAPGLEHLITQAAIAPDGSSIVFVDSVGNTSLLLRKRRDEIEPAPLAGTEGGVSPFFSPDGRWIGYLTIDGRLRKVPVEGGGSITLANSSNSGYLGATWLADGTIVYVGQEQELRRVSADGGESRVVRRSSSTDRVNIATLQALPGSRGVLATVCPGNCGIESSIYVFDFAADSGRMIVPNAAGAWYSPSGHLLYTDRTGGLYAASIDLKRLVLTSGVVPVLEDVAPVSFSLSPSGTALYSVKGGSASSELMWVARDGQAVPLDTAWQADFHYPALSPDGKALAVSVRDGSTQLWIRRADGTRQKLSQTGTVNWRPSWVPDGKALVYLSNMNGAGGQDAYDVYQVPVDGSTAPVRLLHHTFGLWEAELSHDGEWLVVRSDEEGDIGHIRARRLRGSDTALVPLVVGKDQSNEASLSPDGHWLAYSLLTSGRREIYVTSFPNPTSTHVVSRDGGSEPRWAHSGRELFFRGPRRMMVVEVTPGSTFTSGSPRPLFDLSGYRAARNRQEYDVAPDDRHFLMIREASEEAGRNVIYVENWLDEFTANMKARR